MSVLQIFNEQGVAQGEALQQFDSIANTLKNVGVQFERWKADHKLSREADQEEVLATYQASVDTLNTRYDFKSVDVISIHAEHPQAGELRQKFLDEHTHADFEVRFFVEGSGLFYLHVQDKVYGVLCEQGDLISVPAGVAHWFDMGANPDFKCIRFFVIPEGWVGEPTGSSIAESFADYDRFVQERVT